MKKEKPTPTRKEKKVREIKTYTIKLIVYDDDSAQLERDIKGFSRLEALGLLDIVKAKLMNEE